MVTSWGSPPNSIVYSTANTIRGARPCRLRLQLQDAERVAMRVDDPCGVRKPDVRDSVFGFQPREVVSGRAQRVDGRCLDKALHGPGQLPIGGDESVSLQLRQCHVLGVVRRLPPQLRSDLPRVRLQHLVPEEADLERIDAPYPLAALCDGNLTSPRGFIQRGQRL